MPSSEFYDHHESGPCFVGFLCCFGCGGGVRVGVAPEETVVLVGWRRRSGSRVLAGMKAEVVLHASVASMRASSQRRSSGPRGRRGWCRNGRPAGGPPGCARSRPGPPGTRTRRNPPAPGSKNPVAACPGDCRGDRSVEGLSRRGAIPGAGPGTRTGLPAGVQATWRSGPARWCPPECGPGSCFRSQHGTGAPSTTRARAWSGSSAGGTRPARTSTGRAAHRRTARQIEARPAPNDSAGSARARSRRRWAGAAPISSAWLSAGGRPVVRGVRG